NQHGSILLTGSRPTAIVVRQPECPNPAESQPLDRKAERPENTGKRSTRYPERTSGAEATCLPPSATIHRRSSVHTLASPHPRAAPEHVCFFSPDISIPP